MKTDQVTSGSCIYVRVGDTEVIGIVHNVDPSGFADIREAISQYKGQGWRKLKRREFEGHDLAELNLVEVDQWDILYDHADKTKFINVKI